MKWQKGIKSKRAAGLWLPVKLRMNLRSNMAIMDTAKANRRCWLLLFPFNISKWRLEKSYKTIRYISMEAKWNNRRFDDLRSHQIKMILADTSSKLSEDLKCQQTSNNTFNNNNNTTMIPCKTKTWSNSRSQHRSNNIMETQTTLQMMFMAQSGAQCKVLVQGSDDSALLKLELTDRFNIKMSQR